MADFGLAAQIGRGGAGGGVQQVDPANRMMQMMQLQQAQQNAMLQQELAARQRQLFPLEMRKLTGQADTATSTAAGATIGLRREEEKDIVDKAVWDYMDRVDRKLVDPNDPRSLEIVKNPKARREISNILTDNRKRLVDADKAGLDRREVAKAAVYQLIDRSGGGIKDARAYQIARNKILQVEPGAAEFLPDYFNRDNAMQLRDFVASRAATIKDVNGVPTLVRPGSPVAQELSIRRADAQDPAAAGGGVAVAPPAPAVGTQGLVAVQPAMPMSPELAQRTIAATPVPTETPGGAQIIGQRMPAPQTPSPASATVPASQFISERQSVPKPLTAPQERKLRNEIAKDFQSVNATIDQMNSVIGAAKDVADLPEDTKNAIAGWSGFAPSFRSSSREGDRRWRNLEGKITQLGRQAASLSGAIGSMAVQEWKIVRDMIVNTDITNMTVEGLNRQIELIESQARGAMSRVRDTYERQYQEEFGRFGDRFKLPPPSEPSAASAGKGSGKDGVDASNKWLR